MEKAGATVIFGRDGDRRGAFVRFAGQEQDSRSWDRIDVMFERLLLQASPFSRASS